MDGNLAFASAATLAEMVRTKRIGAVELLDLYLRRVERLNPRINAVIAQQADVARKHAAQRDAETAKGESRGALHGVPMTVKEAFDVPGLASTWGMPALRDNIAARTALAVERLENAGAVVFGKTNVPVALADWQTFNPVYGTTSNPWNVERTPGGSSGGSAAALAAGLTGLELGSDIGASIRDPAHYCGVFGHKPTFNVCPSDGHQLPDSFSFLDIAVIGPMARSARDLEIALDIIAGPNAVEARGWTLNLPRSTKTKLSDFRVAVMPTADTAPVDAAVRGEIEKLADFLRRQGAQVDMDARPVDPAEAHEAYIMLLRSATSGGMDQAAWDRLAADRDNVRGRRDYYAWHARANTMSHREWMTWDNIRHRMRRDWEKFFARFDLLLCPTATTTAFPHMQTGERWERMISVDGAPQPTTTQLFWAGYSGMVLLPSTVAPIGVAADGLPVGVQIVAPQYLDYSAIRFAQLLERDYRAFTAPPGFA
ncbi:MAG: amidase [Hyphomicrobiales bacterium]|nr:amidase [Hyphomicrobiales bacterium]